MRDLFKNEKPYEPVIDYEEMVRNRTQQKVVLGKNQEHLRSFFCGLMVKNVHLEQREVKRTLKSIEDACNNSRIIGVLRLNLDIEHHMEYHEKVEKLFKIIHQQFGSRSLDMVQLPPDLGSRNRLPITNFQMPWCQFYNSSNNVKLLRAIAPKLGISFSTGSRCQEPEFLLFNPWKLENNTFNILKGPTLSDLREIEALNIGDNDDNTSTLEVDNVEPIIKMFNDWRVKLGDVRKFKTIEGAIQDNLDHNITFLFPKTKLVSKEKKKYDVFETLKDKKIVGILFAPSWTVGWKLQKQKEFIEKVVEFYYGIKANYGLESIEFVLVSNELNEGRVSSHMKQMDMGFMALPFDSAKSNLALTKALNPDRSIPRMYLLNIPTGRVLQEFIHPNNFDLLDNPTIYEEWVNDFELGE